MQQTLTMQNIRQPFRKKKNISSKLKVKLLQLVMGPVEKTLAGTSEQQ